MPSSLSEKATKYCGEDGQWFRHPDTNRTWSNYTLCNENTSAKLKVGSAQGPGNSTGDAPRPDRYQCWVSVPKPFTLLVL